MLRPCMAFLCEASVKATASPFDVSMPLILGTKEQTSAKDFESFSNYYLMFTHRSDGIPASVAKLLHVLVFSF